MHEFKFTFGDLVHMKIGRRMESKVDGQEVATVGQVICRGHIFGEEGEQNNVYWLRMSGSIQPLVMLYEVELELD